MKTAYLNGFEINDRDDLHTSLADQLDFPAYYGKNLDALYDLLTSTFEPQCVAITGEEELKEKLGGYFNSFIHVLEDISAENDNFSFVIVEDVDEGEDEEDFEE